MTLAEIAKKFDVSLSALKRHKLHHLPRYVEWVAPTETIDTESGPVECVAVDIDGEQCYIPKDVIIDEAKKRYVVCTTPDELEVGRKHSESVVQHYKDAGEPQRWGELIELVEKKAWLGIFKAVQ